MNINEITIDKFFNGFKKIEENKDFSKIFLFNIDITEKDREIILKAIELRKLTNEVREVNNIEKYQRRNAEQVDLKAMIGEYCFSKALLKIYNNKQDKNFLITVPAIAEMILNRKKQDFVVENLIDNKVFNFDVKSQFINNDFNFITVNIKSFETMKKNSDFFIVGLINGRQNDFETNNYVSFYLIKNHWFEQIAKKVLTSNNPKFTPYLKLEIKNNFIL